MTAIRVTDETPIETVLEVVEARTRRLMAELSRTPDAWPTRVARRELVAAIEDSIDEWNDLHR